MFHEKADIAAGIYLRRSCRASREHHVGDVALKRTGGILGFCAAMILFSGCQSGKEKVSTTSEVVTDVASASQPVGLSSEKLGIEVVGLTSSATGYMLDFRYRILDADKAQPLMDPQIKPILIHEKTGAQFSVPNPPKVGALRQRSPEPQANRVFFILFANPGRYVKHGDEVTIVFNDYRIEHLVVE